LTLIEVPDQFLIGSSIAAEAEYIGGSRSGQFLLKHVTTTSAG
jgi:hypothetical protein